MNRDKRGLNLLASDLHKYGEITDPKATKEGRITRILNYKGNDTGSEGMKTAVFQNPNATARHVDIALNGNSMDVLLAAIGSPAATDIQIVRGIGILETKFSIGRDELRDILTADIARYERAGLKSGKNMQRVLALLAKQ